jgi:hypothetical protein
MRRTASDAMSSRSSTISTKRRSRAAVGASSRRLVLCLRNDGYEVSLEPRKFYAALPDRDADEQGQVRVIDESGGDDLFPASLFATVALPLAIRRTLLAAV